MSRMTPADHPLNRNLDVLRAELEESVAETERGETVPMEDVLRMLEHYEALARANKAPHVPAAE